MARRRRWWTVVRSASPFEKPVADADLAGGIDLRTAVDSLPYHDRDLEFAFVCLDRDHPDAAV